MAAARARSGARPVECHDPEPNEWLAQPFLEGLITGSVVRYCVKRDNHSSGSEEAMSRRLLKFSGGSVDD
jgi:hypothetical protein